MKPGLVYLGFSTDFLIEEADAWRGECWRMIKERADCTFLFLTKRIERFAACIPADWADGYDNVVVCCTIENQQNADKKLPVFGALPIRHRCITAQPLIDPVDMAAYLDGVELVVVGGESDRDARPLDYDWVLDIREQCVRKRAFNYVDLSTVCHEFLAQREENDFVLYYFAHQRIWELFPEKARENARPRLIAVAARCRKKHPDKNLRVPFWPKAGLAAYQGMNSYDPRFGEAFYNDSFHAGIAHEELLRGIRCKTLFLKAKTVVGQDGLLMAALGEDDLQRVLALVPDCTLIRFDCGHAIHAEKPDAFVLALLTMA